MILSTNSLSTPVENGASAALTLLIAVEQISIRALICAVRRFSASITDCSSGGNSIAIVVAVPFEVGTANFLAEDSAGSVVFSLTTSFPFLELLATGASSSGVLVSGPIYTVLMGSESVISLSGRFMDFPWMKASLANMLESFCARPDVFGHDCVRSKSTEIVGFGQFFLTRGILSTARWLAI